MSLSEKRKSQNKKWRQSHPEVVNPAAKRWKLANPAKFKLIVQRGRARLKIEVLSAYAGGTPKCACCGESDIRFLTLDHIENNGAAERREVGRKGYGFYAFLRREGFPQNGYQVLCFNCNCSKRSTNNVCPHLLPIADDPMYHDLV